MSGWRRLCERYLEHLLKKNRVESTSTQKLCLYLSDFGSETFDLSFLILTSYSKVVRAISSKGFSYFGYRNELKIEYNISHENREYGCLQPSPNCGL